MKVSVCVTVKNEERSLSKLLDSLLNQTKKPNEIVIVDGGSTDKTVAIIRHYQKKEKIIKLVIEPGNIAHGRNTTIDLARGEIVILTDADCVARHDWLEKITRPFSVNEVGVVAGFYGMPASKPMNKAISVYMGVPSERFDQHTFMPSTRSVAFRKRVWEEIGGFDEKLTNAGEDTKFFYECIKRGVKIIRSRKARVEWYEVGSLSLSNGFWKFFNYAQGDAQTKIWWHPAKQLASHNLKIASIFFRYLSGLSILIFSFTRPYLLLLLAILVILYLLWPVWKWRDVIKDWRARLWLPVVQITSDIAVMGGLIAGLAKRGGV